MRWTRHRTTRLAIVLTAAILAAVITSSGVAQAQGTPAITVTTQPSCAVQGTGVLIDGTSKLAGSQRTVAVRVQPNPPHGTPVSLTAQAQSSGTFATSYTPVDTGNYSVDALTPDGSADAKAFFQVVSIPTIKVSVSPTTVPAEPQSCSSAPPDSHRIIRISGHTDLPCNLKSVNIIITPPAPERPQYLSVRAQNSGDFAASYDAPASSGTYRVRAVAPDNRTVAEATFQVEKSEPSSQSPLELSLVSAPPGQGDDVVFKGATPLDGPGPLKVSFTQPSGPPISQDVPVQPDGSFQFCANNTGTAGNYKVCAQSPGGKYTREVRFHLDPGLSPPDATPVLGQMGVELVSRIEALNRTLPDSSATENLNKDLTDLEVRLLDGLKQIAVFDKALHDILKLRSDYPAEKPAFDGLIQKLYDFQNIAWLEEAKITALLQRSQPGAVQCDDISLIVEELNAVADLISDIEKPMKEVADWEAKTLKGAGPEDPTHYCLGIPNGGGPTPPNAPDHLRFTNALKGLDPGDKPIQYFDTALQQTQSVISKNSEAVFDAYCQKFEGPVTGSMDALVTTAGTRWWRYLIQLEGSLVLRYPKKAAGVVQLSGEFRGTATHVDVWENSYAVLFPKLLNGLGAGYVHKVSAAVMPGGSSPVKLGFGANSLEATSSADFPRHGTDAFGPADFNIPVKGTLDKNSIIITLQPSEHDFEEDVMKMRAKYLVVSPLALVPVFQEIDFPPYKDAHFMLMRAFEGERVEFPITIKPNSMQIAKDFAPKPHGGPVGTQSSATATYKLSVKACNPGCLSNNPSPRIISGNGKKSPATAPKH
jgi:hypothetical protein